MKKISANYIFTGNAAPIKNGVIVISNDGKILDVLDPLTQEISWEEVDLYEGIICPGFINTHCHLELSYLKGEISERKQLVSFIKEIIAARENFTIKERLEATVLAEQEMIKNGIVAVGDISNGNTSFPLKAKGNISYHTFLEIFGLTPTHSNEIIDRANILKKEYYDPQRISITPHAPYSMSQQLINSINKISEGILTIHNQETESENELFLNKSGKLYEQLASFNNDIKKWSATGKNSLPSYLPSFDSDKNILFVHNTYTCKEDVDFAKKYSKNIYWCFCPNANEYIEGNQPNYNLFLNEKCTIGTDSLASNWSLSILDELKTISKKNTSIPLATLIKWATINGAEFLNFNDSLGTFEKGKTPGINLIMNIDVDNMKLKPNSSIKKLI